MIGGFSWDVSCMLNNDGSSRVCKSDRDGTRARRERFQKPGRQFELEEKCFREFQSQDESGHLHMLDDF